jgi:hypothetical protein
MFSRACLAGGTVVLMLQQHVSVLLHLLLPLKLCW